MIERLDAGAQTSPADDAETGQKALIQIGALEGDEGDIFGRISDVEVDSAGTVYVLDFQAADLRWFGVDGRLRGHAGGKGSGPGEFRNPRGLALDGHGRVHVLDPWLYRISTFEPNDGGLVHVRDVRIPLMANEICALGDRLFVLAVTDSTLIHEIDADGAIVRSFGEPVLAIDDQSLRANQWAVYSIRNFQNVGHLYCGAPGAIVMLHDAMPLVRAFTPEGQPLWQTELKDFVRPHQAAYPNGFIAMTVPPRRDGIWHAGVGITGLNPATLVITLKKKFLGDPSSESFQLHLLSMRDGRELRRSRAPFVLAGVHGTRAYGYLDDPYPRVLVVPAFPALRLR